MKKSSSTSSAAHSARRTPQAISRRTRAVSRDEFKVQSSKFKVQSSKFKVGEAGPAGARPVGPATCLSFSCVPGNHDTPTWRSCDQTGCVSAAHESVQCHPELLG